MHQYVFFLFFLLLLLLLLQVVKEWWYDDDDDDTKYKIYFLFLRSSRSLAVQNVFRG